MHKIISHFFYNHTIMDYDIQNICIVSIYNEYNNVMKYTWVFDSVRFRGLLDDE